MFGKTFDILYYQVSNIHWFCQFLQVWMLFISVLQGFKMKNITLISVVLLFDSTRQDCNEVVENQYIPHHIYF